VQRRNGDGYGLHAAMLPILHSMHVPR